MNLIITNHCNRHCPYCFAASKVNFPGGIEKFFPKVISMENVHWYFDFLKRSRLQELKLMGGEPTLHPNLKEIVTLGLDEGFDVIIFTNGLWSGAARQLFEKLEDPRISFIININEPAGQTQAELQCLRQSLAVVRSRGMLGFNIYREDFDLMFVLELINAFGLKRQIRLGLASPIARGTNQYIPTERLSHVGRRLALQLRTLETNDILGSLDCGFTYCMFDECDLATLTLATAGGLISVCQNIIDVGPDLSAWPCFPLSNILNIDLRGFRDFDHLNMYYGEKLKSLRAMGSTDNCLGCKYLIRGQCCGGCLGRTLRQWEENGDSKLIEKIQSL